MCGANNIDEKSHWVGTPEEYFKIPYSAPIAVNTDVLSTLLQKTRSIVNLIVADGEEGHFTSNHNITMHALWAIEGMLGQTNHLLVIGSK